MGILCQSSCLWIPIKTFFELILVIILKFIWKRMIIRNHSNVLSAIVVIIQLLLLPLTCKTIRNKLPWQAVQHWHTAHDTAPDLLGPPLALPVSHQSVVQNLLAQLRSNPLWTLWISQNHQVASRVSIVPNLTLSVLTNYTPISKQCMADRWRQICLLQPASGVLFIRSNVNFARSNVRTCKGYSITWKVPI